MNVLGIDIGGSGIKAAPVNTHRGELIGKRHRIPTPDPPTAKNVARLIAEIVGHFKWRGRVGVGFPGVVNGGRITTAVNLHKSWVGTRADELFAKKTGCPITLINDADAAGLAEIRFGAGKDRMGKVIVLTFGTGIGSALFLDGRLVTNTEFGHLQIRGKIAEARASDRARILDKLSWKAWGKRVAEYLHHVEYLFSPDLFIIGGGASKNFEKFAKALKGLHAEIVPAQHGNSAGIMGAALAAMQ